MSELWDQYSVDDLNRRRTKGGLEPPEGVRGHDLTIVDNGFDESGLCIHKGDSNGRNRVHSTPGMRQYEEGNVLFSPIDYIAVLASRLEAGLPPIDNNGTVTKFPQMKDKYVYGDTFPIVGCANYIMNLMLRGSDGWGKHYRGVRRSLGISSLAAWNHRSI